MSGRDPYRPQPAHQTEVELFSVAGVDGFLREVNVSFADLLGQDVASLTSRSLLELVHPQDVPEVVAGLAALEAGAAEVVLENRFLRPDGSWTHLQWVARPLAGTDLWWAAGRDTTPFHRLRAEGVDLQARLDVATGSGRTAMWELDVPRGTFTWEAAAARLLGLTPGIVPATVSDLVALLDEDDGLALGAAMADLARLGTVDVELSMGGPPPARFLALRGKLIDRDRRGRPVRAVGLLFDRTDEKAMEEQLLRMVMTDALTGVPNRRSFDHTLRTEWRRCSRESSPLSVAIVDIDNFKQCNDTYGHLVGDQVLTLVARTLSTGLQRPGDVLTRFGGEEFGVVLPGADAPGALVVAERLLDQVRGVTLRQAPGWGLTVSVGVATWHPGDTATKLSSLLSRADQALYVAKQAGKDQAVSYEAALADRAQLEERIRAGIEAGEFQLYYQPVVVLETGRVAGFEALLRWERPGFGTVAPDGFIPVAEKSDLICELGRVVLRQATTQLQEWVSAGLFPSGQVGRARETGADTRDGDLVRVAVNLSGRHVADPLVAVDVATALEAAGLAAEQLEVELTETALVDGVRVGEHLAHIRRLGVSVSIDDFGTGYTSVGQLPHLPVDVLKIDRSFVASDEPRQRELVALMISAAHAFDLRVIAEGVEHEDVMTALRLLGCDEAQGYAIARPMPAAAVPTWIRDRTQAGQSA